jgi:ureidoacrylate peracid hydrolase
MELSNQNAALIVVDMQNGFCRPEASRGGLDPSRLAVAIDPCVRLVALARAAGIKIIYTRYMYRADYADGGILIHHIRPELKQNKALIAGTWDIEVVDELKPRDGDFIVDKNRPSSFYGTSLESILNGIGARQLVVCGVTTNCCVETTVRDASQRDYETFVVRDGVAEYEDDRHEVALKSMALLFAPVITVNDVAKAWARTAAA